MSTDHLQRVASQTSGAWADRAVRMGLLTKGTLYFIIGSLAVLTAAGEGGQVTGSQGAVKTLASQPFGRVLLGAAAVGLAAYSLWRLAQAVFDPEHKGTDVSGIAVRLGYAFSGVVHASLCIFAAQLLAGAAAGGGDDKRAWMSELMSHDAGRIALAIAGLVVIGVGGHQVVRGLKEKFRKQLRVHEMSASTRRWVIRVGKAGMVARGVVFAIIGVGLVKASWGAGDSEAPSVEGALHKLARQPYGTFLLAIVALGLACYGVHMMLSARYRRIAH